MGQEKTPSNSAAKQGPLGSYWAVPTVLYLPSFQISAASFHSFPTLSQTTIYLPVTSSGVGG
jgi:hypothetical protein